MVWWLNVQSAIIMVMKWSKYRKFVTAKVTVGDKDGNVYVLTMFSDTIAKVIDGVDGGDVKGCWLSSLLLSG